MPNQKTYDEYSTPMQEGEALELQKEIEHILTENGLHYRLEHVRRPNLKYINFSEISIKVIGLTRAI